MGYSVDAMERAMKVQEVIMRALSGQLTWLQAADILGRSPRSIRRLRWKVGLKLLEKRIRNWLGRRTRKLVERRGRHPEFQALEHEVLAVRPTRVPRIRVKNACCAPIETYAVVSRRTTGAAQA